MGTEKKDGNGFTDQELDGLTDEERAALEGEDDSADALKKIAGEDDDADDAGDKGGEADAAAKAEAEAKAKAETEAKAKAEQEGAAKEAAEAKAKREKELAAMSADDRAKAEAADKAAAAATEQAKKEAEGKTRLEAERKAKAKAGAAADDDDEIDEPFVPAFSAKAPENFDARMTEFDKKDAADLKEFKDEKIEIDEFLRRQRETQKLRDELASLKLKADIASESTEQLTTQQWDWECRRFMRNAAKHDGIDYRKGGNAEQHFDEWNRQVVALGNDKSNNGKPGEWFLTEAHRRTKAILGLKGTQGAPDEAEQKANAEIERKRLETEKKEKEAAAIAARSKKSGEKALPKTLGGVPAAAGTELGKDHEGEFAHLEGLTGLELEVAVAAMKPEEQDRWART